MVQRLHFAHQRNPAELPADDSPAWQINALNTFGNVSRTVNLDAGLFRKINVTAPFFLLPIGNPAGLTFGTITAAVSSGDFGIQRQFQLALIIGF